MDCGHTQVSRVAIFRTLKTECKASTSHQAIGIIKAVRGAVRERQIVGIYMGITQPAVRYTRTSRGQSANRIRPTKPSRCYPSTPSCRHQPSCRSWQKQDDQQRQQTARYHSSKGRQRQDCRYPCQHYRACSQYRSSCTRLPRQSEGYQALERYQHLLEWC